MKPEPTSLWMAVAEVRIDDFVCGAEDVTRVLGVQPSSIHRRGEIVGASKMTWKSNTWILKTPEIDSQTLEDQVTGLLRLVAPTLDALDAVSNNWRARCSYVAYPITATPALVCSTRLMESLLRRRMSLEIDV